MSYKIILIFIISFYIGLTAQVTQNLDNRFNLAQSFEQAGQFGKAEAIYKEKNKYQSCLNQDK